MHNNVMGSPDDRSSPRRELDYKYAPRCSRDYRSAHNIILY